MSLLHKSLVIAALTMAAAAVAEPASYGPQLEGFATPFPLKHFDFESQGQRLTMGYLDVSAVGTPNGRTAILLHGKNFCAATWEATIKVLSHAGYRVVAPDQIGFCTSSKPASYQYTFQQLATNTRALLASLGVEKPVLIAHSTGGMLATRYSLMFPDEVSMLVMVNPIGLEDWKAKGAPYRTVDQWYDRELNLSYESVKAYEQNTYYVGRWSPEYDKWVAMLVGLNQGPGHERVAWNSALIYDMIFTQPVVYEFADLKVPTVLMIGMMDNTAIGSDIAPPEVRKQLGHYDMLGRQVAAVIPKAVLVEFPDLGHAPQIQQPDRFHAELLKALAN